MEPNESETQAPEALHMPKWMNGLREREDTQLYEIQNII